MTPPEKPQDPENPEQGDPDSSATMTRSTDDSATGASAGTSDGQGERGGSTSGGEAPPPWQRATSTSADAPTAGVPAPGSSGSARSSGSSGSVRSSGGSGESSNGSPDSEDTQAIPSPLRDTALGGEQSGDSSDGVPAGRRTVSFTGASGSGAEGTGATSQGGASQGSARRTSRGPRRASLQVKRVDPWSVLKLALVLSVAVFLVWMIAVAVLYGVLGGMGVWDQINGTFTELTQPENSLGEPLISAGKVFGAASVVGAINIVLMTALATVGAFVYNVSAELVGGMELTLSERE